MATVLDRNRVAWIYTADNGVLYRVAAQKALVDQAKQGGADGSTTSLPKPKWLKMRRVTVHNPTYGSRVVPCYTIGSPIAIQGETINLNVNNASFPFVSRGNPLPEGHVIQNVTSQAT
jgi:hypothetical protein